jgi:hypothetical protein
MVWHSSSPTPSTTVSFSLVTLQAAYIYMPFARTASSSTYYPVNKENVTLKTSSFLLKPNIYLFVIYEGKYLYRHKYQYIYLFVIYETRF